MRYYYNEHHAVSMTMMTSLQRRVEHVTSFLFVDEGGNGENE